MRAALNKQAELFLACSSRRVRRRRSMCLTCFNVYRVLGLDAKHGAPKRYVKKVIGEKQGNHGNVLASRAKWIEDGGRWIEAAVASPVCHTTWRPVVGTSLKRRATRHSFALQCEGTSVPSLCLGPMSRGTRKISLAGARAYEEEDHRPQRGDGLASLEGPCFEFCAGNWHDRSSPAPARPNRPPVSPRAITKPLIGWLRGQDFG